MADARHTTMWNSCKPSLRRVDLAFQCSEQKHNQRVARVGQGEGAILVAPTTWKTRDARMSSVE